MTYTQQSLNCSPQKLSTRTNAKKKNEKVRTDYNQSKAFTRAVNKNGSGTQNHSGQTTKNPIVTNSETKK